MISTYLRSDKNLTPEAAAALDQVVKGHLRAAQELGVVNGTSKGG